MVAYRDWVVETSSITGIGPYNLSGSPPAGTSYFTFRQRYANGENEIVYWVVNATRTKWEKNRHGTLTYGTPDTLSRNVVESTNGDDPVSWVGGDAPLRIYVSNDADALDFALGMGLGATRPDALRFGIWVDQDDVSSDIHTLKLFDGTSDVTIGSIDTVQHKFNPIGIDVGDIKATVRTSAPAGWLFASGLTIGNASSGGTARANADTKDLFTLLWNSLANAQAAVSSGRGASAAADYAANKTIALPDLSGRTIAGRDNMSGSIRGLITGGTVLGVLGGAESNTTTMSSTGSTSGALGVTTGSNGMDAPNSTSGVNNGSDFQAATSAHIHANVTATGNTTGSLSVSVSGTSAGFSILQPTIILNYIIKL